MTHSKFSDDLQVCIGTYGDTYAAYYATAEIAYYRHFGTLPEWAVFIQLIETVNDALVIVHRDAGTRD